MVLEGCEFGASNEEITEKLIDSQGFHKVESLKYSK